MADKTETPEESKKDTKVKKAQNRSKLSEEQKRRLIQEVDGHPMLWDRGHERYKDHNKKDELFMRISEKLNIPSQY